MMMAWEITKVDGLGVSIFLVDGSVFLKLNQLSRSPPLWITQELIRISESNRDDHRHEWLRFPKSKYSDRYRYRKKTTSRPDRMIIIN